MLEPSDPVYLCECGYHPTVMNAGSWLANNKHCLKAYVLLLKFSSEIAASEQTIIHLHMTESFNRDTHHHEKAHNCTAE